MKISIAEWLANQPDYAETLAKLPDDELDKLSHNWRFWARPDQLPPHGDWFCWLIRSGRGAGKTWTGANWVIERAKQNLAPIALIAQTKADARDTMVELGPSSIMKVAPPDFMPEYEPSKRRLTFPNGATATVFSGDEPNQLRGPQHSTVWIDELAKFKYPDETWDNMEFGLRLGDAPQVLVTTTPRPLPIIRRLIKDKRTVDIVVSTFANKHNLSSSFLERIKARYDGSRLGKQELYGELLDDTPGALWTADLIDKTRVEDTPRMKRIVVGVDPAVSATTTSNATGIVACGVGIDGHLYILADATIAGTPKEWGKAVINLYQNVKADKIIAEGNQGGDLVKANIRQIDRYAPVKMVRATRNKFTRAEPIATLFEQGKAHIVGRLPQLEDELTTWVHGEKSPDRLDAMVWGATELVGGMSVAVGGIG